MTRIKSHC